jgi:hypothetical protein
MHRSIVATLAFIPLSATAAEGWTIEVYGGAPLNLPTPLDIQQSGEADLHTTARYDTRPFQVPRYYDIRIGRWRDRAEWAIELTHHKIFLTNPPPEVEYFAASHGYNLLTASRGWELPYEFWARVGLGVVISHPENGVRNQRLREIGGIMGLGYYLSGATATASLQKRVRLVGGLFLAAAGMISASYAVLPVVDGRALVPNVAIHGLLGVGYQFGFTG